MFSSSYCNSRGGTVDETEVLESVPPKVTITGVFPATSEPGVTSVTVFTVVIRLAHTQVSFN